MVVMVVKGVLLVGLYLALMLFTARALSDKWHPDAHENLQLVQLADEIGVGDAIEQAYLRLVED